MENMEKVVWGVVWSRARRKHDGAKREYLLGGT